MSAYEYARVDGDASAAALGAVLSQCFYAGDDFWEAYRERMGDENLRVLERAGRIVGGLGLLHVGQWFGGRRVPSGGISAVGVVPEERGGGAAETLMVEALRELKAGGYPISSLYPSNLRLYQKVGYEHAGNNCRHAVPARSLPVSGRELPVRAVSPSEPSALHELHCRWGARNPGYLDRNASLWDWVFEARKLRKFAYVVGAEEEPVGHVVFVQKPVEGGFDLIVRDLSALTPEAAARLLTFFADHRSLAKHVKWWGPASDPLLLTLPTNDWRVERIERWLLRLVDVPAALTARGYPGGVEAEVGLEVEDDVIPENAGRWTLRVADGRGEVEEGGAGGLRLHVRALATLYTGLHTATQLRDLRLLEGDDTPVAAADRIFAGPEPWMNDHF